MEKNSFIIENGYLRKYNGKQSKVVIPNGVERIGYEAFADNMYMVSVEISQGVVRIEEGAFQRCRNLVEVIMPRSLRHIGMGAFARCSSLKEIEIPEGVTDIGCSAFLDCIKLETVNYNADRCRNIRSDGNYNYYTYCDYGNFYDDIYPVFSGCFALKTVNIGEQVRYVPSELFRYSDIDKINVFRDGKLRIGFNAFNQKTDLKKIIRCKKEKDIIFEPLKCYLFPTVEIMPWTEVKHRVWGKGMIVEVLPEKGLINVDFSYLGIKSFLYPDSFHSGVFEIVY